MSNVYATGGFNPMLGPQGMNAGTTPNYGSLGSGPAQYTPNQLLAQQYGQGSRAFYSPFNSPYRPLGVPPGQFNPYQAMQGMGGTMQGQLPPGMPGPSVYQPQMGMPPGMSPEAWQRATQFEGNFGGGGPASALENMRAQWQAQPGGFPGPRPANPWQPGQGQAPGIPPQGLPRPVPGGYQPGSFSAAVAALNRGSPYAQNMLGQAAGLPSQIGTSASQAQGQPPPLALAPQPFGPAFRNMVNAAGRPAPFSPLAGEGYRQSSNVRPPSAGFVPAMPANQFTAQNQTRGGSGGPMFMGGGARGPRPDASAVPTGLNPALGGGATMGLPPTGAMAVNPLRMASRVR
jgi:hypothetical protein